MSYICDRSYVEKTCPKAKPLPCHAHICCYREVTQPPRAFFNSLTNERVHGNATAHDKKPLQNALEHIPGRLMLTPALMHCFRMTSIKELRLCGAPSDDLRIAWRDADEVTRWM